MAAPEAMVFINGKKVLNGALDISVLENCPVHPPSHGAAAGKLRRNAKRVLLRSRAVKDMAKQSNIASERFRPTKPNILGCSCETAGLHVFETLRVYDSSIFCMKEHIDRLFASAKTIGLSISKSRQAVENNLFSVLSCIKKKNDVFLRLTVTAGDIIIFVFNRSHPDAIYRRGIDLNTTAVRRHSSHSFPPEAKTNQFLNGILGRLDVRESRVDDALFLDQDGNVRELSVWNIFIVKNGEIITPPPIGILDGVTRRFVIECAHVKRFHVEEKELTRHDIWNSDEMFVTNTSGEIVPVRSLDGRRIGNQIPGPVTKILQRQFHKEINR